MLSECSERYGLQISGEDLNAGFFLFQNIINLEGTLLFKTNIVLLSNM